MTIDEFERPAEPIGAASSVGTLPGLAEGAKFRLRIEPEPCVLGAYPDLEADAWSRSGGRRFDSRVAPRRNASQSDASGEDLVIPRATSLLDVPFHDYAHAIGSSQPGGDLWYARRNLLIGFRGRASNPLCGAKTVNWDAIGAIGEVVGAIDLASLTPRERLRFAFIMMAFLRRAENIQRQSSQNRVSPEEWAGLRISRLSVMAQPGSISWWEENADRFNPDFADWLNGELEKRPVSQTVAAETRPIGRIEP